MEFGRVLFVQLLVLCAAMARPQTFRQGSFTQPAAQPQRLQPQRLQQQQLQQQRFQPQQAQPQQFQFRTQQPLTQSAAPAAPAFQTHLLQPQQQQPQQGVETYMQVHVRSQPPTLVSAPQQQVLQHTAAEARPFSEPAFQQQQRTLPSASRAVPFTSVQQAPPPPPPPPPPPAPLELPDAVPAPVQQHDAQTFVRRPPAAPQQALQAVPQFQRPREPVRQASQPQEQRFQHARTQQQQDSPRFQQESPRFQQESPRFQQDSPRFQQETPRFQQASPQIQQETPRFQQASPQIQQETPRFQQASPQIQQETPRFQQASPQIQQETPRFQQASPQIQQETPRFQQDSSRLQQEASRFQQDSFSPVQPESQRFQQTFTAQQESATLPAEPEQDYFKLRQDVPKTVAQKPTRGRGLARHPTTSTTSTTSASLRTNPIRVASASVPIVVPSASVQQDDPALDNVADEEAREQNKNAQYSFSSSIDDTLTDNSQVRQETRDGLNVSGLYSYSDGYFMRTVHYEADENGYRVIKEDVEPIGNGPQLNPDGAAEVQAQISGTDFRYRITADDIVKENRQQAAQPVQQYQRFLADEGRDLQ